MEWNYDAYMQWTIIQRKPKIKDKKNYKNRVWTWSIENYVHTIVKIAYEDHMPNMYLTQII
jgi:hypothetical protein